MVNHEALKAQILTNTMDYVNRIEPLQRIESYYLEEVGQLFFQVLQMFDGEPDNSLKIRLQTD